MARMRTFLIYVLCLIGFIILSFILEDALISDMYKKMQGTILQGTDSSAVVVDGVSGRATNVNGYIDFELKNTLDEAADGYYVKIDLYDEQGNTSATKYVEITDLAAGETKDYNVIFNGTEVSSYTIDVLKPEEVPDRSNVITIFGYDIDTSNLFGTGLDVSNISIFGHKLGNIINVNSIKSGAKSAYQFAVNFVNTIPWWGYAIGACVIFWYLPKGFLFGL